MAIKHEIRYFDALRAIADYQSPEWLRKNAERAYGLQFEEAIEYAYDNVRETAKAAIRGRRRPVSIDKKEDS